MGGCDPEIEGSDHQGPRFGRDDTVWGGGWVGKNAGPFGFAQGRLFAALRMTPFGVVARLEEMQVLHFVQDDTVWGGGEVGNRRSFTSFRMTPIWGGGWVEEMQVPSASLRAGSFGFAQGRLLRLRSGQAPSASLRAGSFGFAQGRLLRLRSGQAPSASLRDDSGLGLWLFPHLFEMWDTPRSLASDP